MKSCPEIQEMISAMLDGEILDSDRTVIENHIKTCPECAAMYEDFDALSDAFAEEIVPVPASLHGKIMKRVRTSAKPKKPLIIQLRPYMSAAACLVVVVGAVFALRGGDMSFDKKSDNAMVASFEAPAAPAAPVEVDFGPAEFAVDESAAYGSKNAVMEDSAIEEQSPEMPVPAPEPVEPAAPAEPAVPYPEDNISNNVTITADRDTDLSEFEAYLPGTAIDEAWMVFYHDSGIVEYRPLAEPAELAKLLEEGSGKVKNHKLPEKANVFLRIYVDGVQQPVKLYFTSKGVVAETAEGFYVVSGSEEDFAKLSAKNFTPVK